MMVMTAAAVLVTAPFSFAGASSDSRPHLPAATTASMAPPAPPAHLAALTLTAPLPPRPPAQSTFAEIVESARQAWASPDAEAIVATGRRLLLQLPGSEFRAAVGREQAVRLVAESLRRVEVVTVRVVSAREVGPGQGYAELLRHYRVTGTGETRSQRILLAFRRDPSRGGWELVELRVLPEGG